MTYTARQLVTDAYYLSKKYSRGFQTVTGDDINYGLTLLNDVLAVKTVDKRMIPFFQEYILTLVPGQEMYFISNLVDIETVTYFIDNVRFPTRRLSRREYFGDSRVETIQSLPITWHCERTKNGSDVFFYFLPDQAYTVNIWGKFSLSTVTTLDQDLTIAFEQNYIVYLKHATAKQISLYFGIPWDPILEKEFFELEKSVTDISPYDFTFSKKSTLDSRMNGADIFCEANLKLGWEVE